ncbi:hypothetical protein OGAPHI_006840 [Ogataea philodendri]|uniref:Major facilitator superfamily (MFS) profile domain-containing protein n=1 Tax=Ogataea philodendri TaxID=1378263 RepID=A0A9P8NW78_9ASCO|nr:uncharacterized protein OGAPHI_006840 [Ogataea philodendri]KAH3661433.1 hypothetical protein OGAPHI_006840 [Ogataea philodendri]
MEEKQGERIEILTKEDSFDQVDTGEIIEETQKYDKKMEYKICRKLDFRILPVISLMYLFNSLDKGNISNAKTDGIEKDLGIGGQEWNNMVMIFYVPFCLCGFPLSIVIRKFGPANTIPLFMFGFGCVTLLSASAFNYGSLMAARWFLGIFESAFFPGIIFYLSTFYRRNELARRLSIFYAASNIANAFSGLLAFGVFQINSNTVKGWQILYIIEGGASVVWATFSFWWLPRKIESCKFFSEEEREYALYRINVDASASHTEGMKIWDSIKVFFHPVAVIWLIQEFCLGVPLNSVNSWFPQIIGSFGKSTVMTNLYTVAPNVWGAISLLLLCFGSDLTRMRSAFVLIALIGTLLGFVVFGCIDIKSNLGAAYFCCFLMTTGTSASSVLTSTWYNNNTPNENRRLVMSAIGVPICNSAGLISANIFRSKDAPKYVPALAITAAFGGVSACCVVIILVYMIIDNKRRNRAQNVNWTYKDVPTHLLAEGPKNPNYRWMY